MIDSRRIVARYVEALTVEDVRREHGRRQQEGLESLVNVTDYEYDKHLEILDRIQMPGDDIGYTVSTRLDTTMDVHTSGIKQYFIEVTFNTTRNTEKRYKTDHSIYRANIIMLARTEIRGYLEGIRRELEDKRGDLEYFDEQSKFLSAMLSEIDPNQNTSLMDFYRILGTRSYFRGMPEVQAGIEEAGERVRNKSAFPLLNVQGLYTKVMTTVILHTMRGMKKFAEMLPDHYLAGLLFSAVKEHTEDDRRERIYDRLIRKFIGVLGVGVSEVLSSHRLKEYIFTRPLSASDIKGIQL